MAWRTMCVLGAVLCIAALGCMLRPNTIDLLTTDVSWYSKPPSLGPITLMASLPFEYVPTPDNGRRLLVVGDIHGMLDPLDRLLAKAKFDAPVDHIVALGDMVNKGPNSRGVVSRLMNLNASAVRGNHEDKLLLLLQEHLAGSSVTDAKERRLLKVGKSLARRQVEWLAGLPVILTADPLPIYFVHGGLVPGVKLARQDPWAVMNMRTLIYPRKKKPHSMASEDVDATAIPVDDHSGEDWSRAWDREQKHTHNAKRKTVMYGHDAKRGFTETKYAVGLDSGCVRGGHLTGLIVEADGDGFAYKKVQVPCEAEL